MDALLVTDVFYVLFGFMNHTLCFGDRVCLCYLPYSSSKIPSKGVNCGRFYVWCFSLWLVNGYVMYAFKSQPA